MNKHIEAIRTYWDELVPIHTKSDFYDVEGFKAGKNRLDSVILEEVGDVKGKSLLHLMCHFGLDTLSWGRLGATATGVDFSRHAIDLAETIARDVDMDVRFVCSDVYDATEYIKEQFDIVFMSSGVLCWLPDLRRLAGIIERFLKPGGMFYIREYHPIVTVFNEPERVEDLRVEHHYFHRREPTLWEPWGGSYADRDASVTNNQYEWTHSLSDVTTALLDVGLTLEFFHEFPFSDYQCFLAMERGDDGFWRLPSGKFAVNYLILLLAMFAYNALRLIGQSSLDYPAPYRKAATQGGTTSSQRTRASGIA